MGNGSKQSTDALVKVAVEEPSTPMGDVSFSTKMAKPKLTRATKERQGRAAGQGERQPRTSTTAEENNAKPSLIEGVTAAEEDYSRASSPEKGFGSQTKGINGLEGSTLNS